MRIDQLRYLIEIAKSHSMHATSIKMHISPQALSATIKALERELDLELLQRSFQGTELTTVGEEISKISEEFLQKLDAVVHTYHNLQLQHQEYFDFYFSPNDEMDNFVPKLVTDLIYKNFDLPLRTAELSEEELKIALEENRLEVVVAFIYKLNDTVIINPYPEYAYKPLCSMRYCCRVSKNSPLNQHMSLSLKTVLKNPLLHFSPRTGENFLTFIKALSEDNCHVQILKHHEIYKEKLINNHGVSLVVDIPYKDKSNIEYIPGTVDIPIKENLQRELCLIYKPNTVFSERSQQFIKILTDHIAYTIYKN